MSSQQQFWNFLNSQIGLLISGFVLTTIAGTYLTTWYKRESKKHEVRFVQLHEERAKAIKIFHDKTIVLKKELEQWELTSYDSDTNKIALNRDKDEAWEKVEDFTALAEEYKIYFSKDLCALIDTIQSSFVAYWFDILMRSTDADESFMLEFRARAIAMARNLTTLIESLRQEFRKLLGVEEQ